MDSNEFRAAMSTWFTLAMSNYTSPTLMDLSLIRDWIDGGCVGDMPTPEGE